jgi:hypothetical protein
MPVFLAIEARYGHGGAAKKMTACKQIDTPTPAPRTPASGSRNRAGS